MAFPVSFVPQSITGLYLAILLALAVLLAVVSGTLACRLRRVRLRQREQAMELEEARRQESLGTLAGGVAHDFNNILGSILGFGVLLEDDLLTQPELRELAHQITVAARRGQKIVSQLMSYSRKNMDEDKHQHMPVSLNEIVEENLKLVRPSIRASSKLIYQNNTKENVIYADATQLGQVIVNLCINADHAIGAKAGQISLQLDDIQLPSALQGTPVRITGGHSTTDPVRIINGTIKQGRYLRLTVRDNGEGMTPQVATRIFDPFFTTKDVNVGTGLGLPAIQGIMHSHDGAITVSTLRFKGTVFELLFPVPGKDEKPSQMSSSTV